MMYLTGPYCPLKKYMYSNFVSQNGCNFTAVVKCQEAEILCKKALI